MHAMNIRGEAKQSDTSPDEGRKVPSSAESALLAAGFAITVGLLWAIVWTIRPALPPAVVFQPAAEPVAAPVVAVQAGSDVSCGG